MTSENESRTWRIMGEAPARPAWLTSAHWPYEPEVIGRGDRSVTVTVSGSGPTLLLVHVGMWSLVWRDVIARLQGHFRCITLDPPGTGLTPSSTGVDIDGAAAAIDLVVEHFELDRFTPVVHDLGGPVTLQAIDAWPDRVEALAAVNTFGWPPSGIGFRSMLALMGNPVMAEIDAVTGWVPRLTATRFGVGRRWDRSTRLAFRRGMDRRGRRSFHRYMGSVRRHDFARVERAVAAIADRPLLTVFGQRNDPLRFQPKWAARFDDHTRVVVPQGYHFPMCDAPELVADAVAGWHRATVERAPSLRRAGAARR